MSEGNDKTKDEERPKNLQDHDDDDGWETDEETLVHVHVSGVFQKDLGKQTRTKFVGLDSGEPVVQLGNQVFAGHYEDIVGTALFFESNKGKKPGEDRDPVFEGPEREVDLSYKCKTNRRLVLKRVFLKAKNMDADK